MPNNSLSKNTVSFGLALAISSLANALLVIAKEKSPAVQSKMQKLTGSHWITHVAIILILFFAIGFISKHFKGGQGITPPINRLIKIIVGGILTAAAMIIGFYLVAD